MQELSGTFPYDLLVLLVCSVILNIILARKLMEKIARLTEIETKLTNVIKSLKKEKLI